MEIRTLRYFLEAAREENMSKAAERMHISQSALSKQLKGLEEELGKKLFVRHSFSIELTKEGMLLRKRAEDLLSMADKITAEFASIGRHYRRQYLFWLCGIVPNPAFGGFNKAF